MAAMEEFAGEGRGGSDDNSMVGREMKGFGELWATEEGFAAYVASLEADSREETLRADYLVPSTTYWWIEGDSYLGRIAIRHRLTERLLELGGHIGYDVRPSARRQGHATAMLRATLPRAHALGIDPALLTCDAGNVASRRVIVANGGVLEDQRGDVMRFWVPTG
jgi:predicted acetyltransferase